MINKKDDMSKDIPIEEQIFHLIDTQCSECGHLYAMLDFETESTCPKCGNKEYYAYLISPKD